MSYPINYPTPQNANVQIFRGGDAGQTDIDNRHQATRDWVKPQGASFVWFTLIGAGGGGGGGMFESEVGGRSGGGGASGNVTNFMCPAFLLPDVLQVAVGRGGNGGSKSYATDSPGFNGANGDSTQIIYQQKDEAGYTILMASGGPGGTGGGLGGNGAGGTANAANPAYPMTAAGFYNATGGQNGKTSVLASTNGLTFLMGGSGVSYYGNGYDITGYYGYVAQSSAGYSQISPIIMSIAGSRTEGVVYQTASPFGCGGNGGGNSSDVIDGNRGGDGLAIIVTW
jgi:hypothetical protein